MISISLCIANSYTVDNGVILFLIYSISSKPPTELTFAQLPVFIAEFFFKGVPQSELYAASPLSRKLNCMHRDVTMVSFWGAK